MTPLRRLAAAVALVTVSSALQGCPPSEDVLGSAPTNGDIVDPAAINLVQSATASVAATYPLQCPGGRCIELRLKSPICPKSLSPAQFAFALVYPTGRPVMTQACGTDIIASVFVANTSGGGFLGATPAQVADRYAGCFGGSGSPAPDAAVQASLAPPGWYDTVILALEDGVLGDGRDVDVLARLGTAPNCAPPPQPPVAITEIADVQPSTNCPGGATLPNGGCLLVTFRLADAPRPLDEGAVATFYVRTENGAPGPLLASSTLRDVAAGGLLIPSPPPPAGLTPILATRWFPPHGRMTGTFAQGEAAPARFGMLIERDGITAATVEDITAASDIRVLGLTGAAFAVSDPTFEIVHAAALPPARVWPIGTHLANVEILTDASLVAAPNPFRFQLPPATQTDRGVAFDTQNGLDEGGPVTISWVRFDADELTLSLRRPLPDPLRLSGSVGENVTSVEIRVRGNSATLLAIPVVPGSGTFRGDLDLRVIGSRVVVEAHAYGEGGQYLGYDEVPLNGAGDPDSDGVFFDVDNCPDVFNPDQSDYNPGTMAGAACETSGDLDGDGRFDAEELAAGLDPWLSDTDGDGLGDGRESLSEAKDPDTDGDGELDGTDYDDATGAPLDEDRDGIEDRWDPDDNTPGIDSSDIWFVDQDWRVTLNNGSTTGEGVPVTNLNATIHFTLHYLLAFGQNWLTTAEPALQPIPDERTANGTWASVLRADDVGLPFVSDITVKTESCAIPPPDGATPATCQVVPILRAPCTDEGFDTPGESDGAFARPDGTFVVPEYPSGGFVGCGRVIRPGEPGFDPRFGRIGPSSGGLFAGGADLEGRVQPDGQFGRGGYLAAPAFDAPPGGLTFAVCEVASTPDGFTDGGWIPGTLIPGQACKPVDFLSNATFDVTSFDGMRLDFLTAMTARVLGTRPATAHLSLSEIRSLLTGGSADWTAPGPTHTGRGDVSRLSFSGMGFTSVARQVSGTRFRPMRLRFVDGTVPRAAPGAPAPGPSGTDRLWNGRSGYRASQTSPLSASRTSDDWFRMQVHLDAPAPVHDRVVRLLADCDAIPTGFDSRGRPFDSLARCTTHLSIRVGNASRARGSRCWPGYVEGVQASCNEAIPPDDELFGVVLSQNVPFKLLVDSSAPLRGGGGVRVRWTGQPETIETLNIIRDPFGASPGSVAEVRGCMDFGIRDDLLSGSRSDPLTAKGTVVPGAYRVSVRGLHATDRSAPEPPNCSAGVLEPVRIDRAPVNDWRNIWVTPVVAARDYGSFVDPWTFAAHRPGRTDPPPGPGTVPAFEIRSDVDDAQVAIARSSFDDEVLSHFADVGVPVEVYTVLTRVSGSVATDSRSYRTLPPFSVILMTTHADALLRCPFDSDIAAGLASRAGFFPPQSLSRACVFVESAWDEAFSVSRGCLTGPSRLRDGATGCVVRGATDPVPRMGGSVPDMLALGGREMGFVALHEIGHLLGLDHVRYREQLIFACGGASADCSTIGSGLEIEGGGVGPGLFVHVMEGPELGCTGVFLGGSRDPYFVRRGLLGILDSSWRNVIGRRVGMWAEPLCTPLSATDSRCSRVFKNGCYNPSGDPTGRLIGFDVRARYSGLEFLKAQYGTRIP